MIVIKIMGGLGNQMFQYAYGRNLELKGKKIIFDTSFFYGQKSSGDTTRDFQLDKFSLLTRARFSPQRYIWTEWLNKIKRRLGFKMYIDYPSEKYFAEAAEIIRKEFVLKKDLSGVAREILEKIEISNSVSLHVRRGDYIKDKKINAYHGVCDLNYYRQAIKIIKEKTTNPIFFIFSDDSEWVKDNFKGEEFVFVSSPLIEDIEDIILMSHCKHHIIANSSFSWWGAWLGTNSKKIVIAPKKWLNVKKAGVEEIVPDDWIKI